MCIAYASSWHLFAVYAAVVVCNAAMWLFYVPIKGE